jgi:hypothetical protein
MKASGLSSFDRAAWRASYAAPASWLGLGGSIVANALMPGLSTSWQSALLGLALVGGACGLASHAILSLHALKSRSLSMTDRDALWRILVLCGYGRWRDYMRPRLHQLDAA